MSEASRHADSPFRHVPPTAFRVRGGDLWLGAKALWQADAAIADFSAAISAWIGPGTCHMVNSGRGALVVILTGLRRLSHRRQVIVPAYGCPTVVQSVLTAGLDPVFCDLSPQTLDFDRAALAQLVSEKVLAIVPAHLYGLAHDVRDLLDMGRVYGFWVVEDAAQAFGSRVDGKMVGTWGDAGLYSLSRGKCIPAGHGGVIVSREGCADAIREAVREAIPGDARADLRSLFLYAVYGLVTHPRAWWLVSRTALNPADLGMDLADLPPIHVRALSPVQAALGRSILTRLGAHQAASRDNAQRLMDHLAEYDGFCLPRVAPCAEPVFLRLPIVVESKLRADRLFGLLEREGIGVSRSYWRSLPDLFSERLGTDERTFPGAAKLARCLLTLPTHTYLRDDDLARVARAFERWTSEGG